MTTKTNLIDTWEDRYENLIFMAVAHHDADNPVMAEYYRTQARKLRQEYTNHRRRPAALRYRR